MLPREDELLALLNSAPVIDGVITETLEDDGLRRLRDDLQRVIRGTTPPSSLSPYLRDVRQSPLVVEHGVEWVLRGPAATLPLAELVLEWDRVQRAFPGRLRACSNPECTRFLLDHSKPNTARWCSMASCGNRMKARRHRARRAELAGS